MRCSTLSETFTAVYEFKPVDESIDELKQIIIGLSALYSGRVTATLSQNAKERENWSGIPLEVFPDLFFDNLCARLSDHPVVILTFQITSCTNRESRLYPPDTLIRHHSSVATEGSSRSLPLRKWHRLRNVFWNQSLFLVCNGPSFQKEDKTWINDPGVILMGLNNGAASIRPHLWVSVDAPATFSLSIWDDPAILKFVPYEHASAPLPAPGDGNSTTKTISELASVFFFQRSTVFSERTWLTEQDINWGETVREGAASVLLAALKLGYCLGFRTVYLLGCDFQMTPERPYWFDERKSRAGITANNQQYVFLQSYLRRLEPVFRAANYRVFNLNPESSLQVFPFLTLKDALRASRLRANAAFA
jgi:hypothetical protein